MSVATTYTDALADAFRGETLVVLDAEGVDLSRCGKISIVQIATRKECFLIDVLDKARDDPLVNWLRGVLEDEAVTKIIHDCRMDSDALFHLLGIRLAGVYDTTCWNTAITDNENQNLNTVLANNGIKPNVLRDGNVYATNPAFWATRPLTPKMIEWAAGDVTSLFEVREKQIARATAEQAEKATAAGEFYLTVARDAMVANVKVKYPGLFIGTGGANLRSLQRRTSTLIYTKGSRADRIFMVFYKKPEDFATVKADAEGF